MIAAPSDPNHTLLPAREIGRGEGHVMVRRRGLQTRPFVVTEHEWADAPVRGS